MFWCQSKAILGAKVNAINQSVNIRYGASLNHANSLLLNLPEGIYT